MKQVKLEINTDDNIIIGNQAGQTNNIDSSIFIGASAGKINYIFR